MEEKRNRKKRKPAPVTADGGQSAADKKGLPVFDEIHAQWGIADPDPKSPDAAQIVEDAAWRDEQRDVEAFFVSAHLGDEAVFLLAERKAEWAKLKQAAEAAARKDGIDTGNPDAVKEYLKAAMAENDAAVCGDEWSWTFLPNTDWRIRAARRHGDKIVAAMLYREAADAAKAEAAAEKERDAAFVEERKQQVAAFIAAYERRKAQEARKTGKGISRHAGETFRGGTYHVCPDGQTIEVKGDSLKYKITSKAALETLDQLLDGATDDGWVSWSSTGRSRFSTPSAKAFAKKYIENERSKAGFGFNYGHEPRARLKP